ncbi:hypothetical protein IV203_011460 [Nitzschia inconspicua]|uniref:Uncharacterized protein n=1 Tax=Nitzschia inconspicua TaxID=303405 RepID=A0A9K3KS27_9STRA|nr:hypothetical protein IV203_011460 [Nitzschia inconspicua]
MSIKASTLLICFKYPLEEYMLAGPIGAMVLPLTDDAPKVTKEILGHALELTIHHPTIGPKICNKWITVDTIIDAIRAAAVIDTSMVMNARLLNILLSKIQKYQLIDRFDGSNLSVERRSGKGEEFDFISVAEIKRHSTSRTPAGAGIKGSSVQRRATYCVNPRTRKVISMNVNKILIMLICHGSNQCAVLIGIRQRPTSFSGQDSVIRIVSQPLRDSSNYFREHNNLKAGEIWSMDEIHIMTREAFLHPNLEARVGRDPLPPFLRMFPDAATEIKQFCRVNLLNLNVETVHQFILNKVFPRIYAVWASEQKSRGHTLQSFLKLFRISVFSPQTTLSWMKQLGMKYANHKKSYYVDGHEREDVVTSRKLFCKRYLVDLEPRRIRWIQITKEKASELPSLSMDFGHEYMEGDIKMVEFHEDYIDKAGMDLTQFEKK